MVPFLSVQCNADCHIKRRSSFAFGFSFKDKLRDARECTWQVPIKKQGPDPLQSQKNLKLIFDLSQLVTQATVTQLLNNFGTDDRFTIP